MGTENKVDYASILADLEAKKTALENAIASFRMALALGALGQPGDASIPLPTASSTGEPVDLPVGALLGKSIPAAIKMYLSAVRKKMGNKEIAAALKEQGVESTSGNFEGIVNGALRRLKESGEVLRFKDGWALAALYPDHLRSKISQERKPTKKKKKVKKAAKPKEPEIAKETVQAVPPSAQPLEKRIEEILKRDVAKEFSFKEIAKLTSTNASIASLALGRMVKKGKAQKSSEGKYRAV